MGKFPPSSQSNLGFGVLEVGREQSAWRSHDRIGRLLGRFIPEVGLGQRDTLDRSPIQVGADGEEKPRQRRPRGEIERTVRIAVSC